MRTTSVRKLLPEAWGFLCPVHTPDGAPCGLLNHLAAPCQVGGGEGVGALLATSCVLPVGCDSCVQQPAAGECHVFHGDDII